MDDREFWLQRRKALLLEIEAIERRFPTRQMTIVVRRDEAERKGLCKSDESVVLLAQRS